MELKDCYAATDKVARAAELYAEFRKGLDEMGLGLFYEYARLGCLYVVDKEKLRLLANERPELFSYNTDAYEALVESGIISGEDNVAWFTDGMDYVKMGVER